MAQVMAKFDDTTLIRMAVTGHGESFSELVRRHMNPVRRRVESLVHSPTHADDIVQEVFIKAWRSLPKFRADSTLRTWLMSIANNEALMFHRREQRRRKRETPGESDTVACRSESADRALIRVEVNRAIHSAILSFPTRYREVVILRDVEELSLEETAKQLKATLSGVKTRLFRGRRKVAAVLRSRERTVFHAAA